MRRSLFYNMKRLLSIILFLCIFQVAKADPTDSIYAKDIFFNKLVKTNSPVPVFYNEQVKRQIGVYMKNLNNSTAMLLGKAQYYHSLYASKFEQAGIPKQLFLVCASYSNCDPLFSDQDGGSGMWTFSYAIAKKYSLVTNSYIDERRNPEKSADAAVSYFKDLNDIYQDWLKSIVAFRTGPINMNMAIHKANNTLDYARIHNMLSPEYQNAAVNYMAFWYIWNYYTDHKIIPVKYKLPDTDTIQVQREISLNAIAYNLNISEDVLRLTNSELRIDIVPMSYNIKGLRLPKDKIAEYHQKQSILFPPSVVVVDSTLGDSLIMDNPLLVKPVRPEDNSNSQTQEEEEDENPKKPAKDSKTVTIIYVVKKGDGLLLIADLFDCKTSDIKKWNGMRKDAIFKGQKLKIHVPKNKAAQYKKINTMTMVQKRKLAKKS
jgi:membrane-bound lytic murein transglycosylase D